MDRSLQRVLVLGAGAIGGEIALSLYRKGYGVWVASRSNEKLERLRDRCVEVEPEVPNPTELTCWVMDVRHISASSGIGLNLWHTLDPGVWAMIYAVGSGPPGGFTKAIETPLSTLRKGAWEDTVGMYVTGFMDACCVLLPMMREGGHIVAISSAITRLTPETCPPWLHAWHYVAAKAALDKLVQGFRHDPLVRRKNILVHRIAPAAVDTPFHHGAPPDRQPPALLPVQTVVDEVLAALEGNEVVDKDLVPAPK